MKKRKFPTKVQIQNWIKNKQQVQWVKALVYSRLLITMLLVVFQIFLFFLFVLRFQPYIEYFLGGSLFVSFFFIVYLVNTSGKNEFKIAWMLPLLLFPIFGIAAYIMFHINHGGRKLKKRLIHVKEQTKDLIPSSEATDRILNENSHRKDICSYMINTANYYPYEKNQLTYLKNGETYLPVLLEELKKAQKFIFMEFFIVFPDEAWEQILDVLEERSKAGVEVRLLFDGFGSLIVASKKYMKYLESRGAKCHMFLPLVPLFSTQLNNRDHRKIVVIDGHTAFTGGINLTNEYFNIGKNRFNYWKDNAVMIKGSAAMSFTTMFLQNWYIDDVHDEDYNSYLLQEYPAYEQKGITLPYGDDAYNDEDIAEDLYIYLINSAKKYIHITSPYLVIDNQIYSQLILARKLGIEVSLILPSVPDHMITFCIGRVYVKKLIENGINVYFYNKGFIHAKTVICDGQMASVGSVNLDYRSFYHHFECGVLMCDNPVVSDIEEDFQETLKDCTLVTREEYKKIPKRQRFVGWLFRIFSPLM